jgi:membrane-associated phospholipid phosphatase/putative flippase GtrA
LFFGGNAVEANGPGTGPPPNVPLLASFRRSLVASAGATVFDFLVSIALYELTPLGAWSSTASGSVAGGVTNYLANRWWSFESRAPVAGEASRYAIVSGASAIANSVGVELFVRAGVSYAWAWLAMRALVFALLTLPLFRLWVFRAPAAEPPRLWVRTREIVRADRWPEHAWLFLVPPIVFVLGAFQGFRLEYTLASIAFAALALVGPRSRRFAAVILPLAAVGVLYDHIGPLMDLRGPIQVDSLYHAELAIFGIPTASGRVLPSEWLSSFAHPAIDLVTGFSYLAYLYWVFVAAGYLYFRRDPDRARRLAWGFLLLNAIGIATWVIFPAAPPWYVEQYGLGPANLAAHASAAGAARFDAIVGFPYFEEFYARSRNVFGAMPSLHVAYPTLVFIALARRRKPVAIGALAFALLVAFSAIYLEHHYVLDVLGGVLAAVVAALAVGLFRATASTVETASESASGERAASEATPGTAPTWKKDG